jgi:hypothetical protein
MSSGLIGVASEDLGEVVAVLRNTAYVVGFAITAPHKVGPWPAPPRQPLKRAPPGRLTFRGSRATVCPPPRRLPFRRGRARTRLLPLRGRGGHSQSQWCRTGNRSRTGQRGYLFHPLPHPNGRCGGGPPGVCGTLFPAGTSRQAGHRRRVDPAGKRHVGQPGASRPVCLERTLNPRSSGVRVGVTGRRL